MKKTIDLSGTFGFLLDTKKEGLQHHFEQKKFTDTIQLPGTTSQAQKGPVNQERPLGYLTDLYKMEGYSWYQKTLSIDPSDLGKTFYLTLERTRVSYVWVDETFVGSFDSFVSQHVYDLSSYIISEDPVLTIMVSNTDYKVPGGHMTSPDTQTNWNGILGNITLSIYDSIHITAVKADCDYKNQSALLTIQVDNLMDCREDCCITVSSHMCHLEESGCVLTPGASEYQTEETLSGGKNEITLTYDLSEPAHLWDEEDPYFYKLTVSVIAASGDAIEEPCGDTFCLAFGLKEFIAGETHFQINGRKTFLRGKHEGMIFPLTGYAPMDVDGWLKVMKTAKDFGINHYRFHTCCPPDAAFLAADLLGIYMEPELPFWGTFTAKGDEGHNEEAQNFLIEEGFRILDSYANHPSFVMMSMGNELWGSPEAINELLGRYKAYRPHILYTQGSNNFQWVPNIQPNDDFFCGVRFTIDRQIRGSYAMCDKPLGHVQTDRPGTMFNYEEAIHPTYNAKASEVSADGTIEIQYGTGVKRVKLTDAQEELIPHVPVLSHEIGQYETYPDFTEIDKYTGVLRARNMEQFRDALDQKGLLPLANDYFKNSGALAVACYKDELETALRTESLAGFQILDIQDFSGQGTALVGVLNAFMENKGLITSADWRQFCSSAVLQAEFETYVHTCGDLFAASLSLAYFRKDPLAATSLTCQLTTSDGTLLFEKVLPVDSITENGRHELGSLRFTIPELTQAASLELTIQLEGCDIQNHYTLWVYPATTVSTEPTVPALNQEKISTCIAHSLSEALNLADTSSHVLLFLSTEENKNSIEGTYSTDFWCYPMFRSISESMNKEIPVGTMGLLIQKDHPALSGFPCRSYTTPQWFSIITASRSTILDDTKILPIVQTIDNFERNHRLGLLYEVYLADKDCTLTICTSDLPALVKAKHPEALSLFKSLTNYLIDSSVVENEKSQIYSMDSDSFLQLFQEK